MRTTFLSAAPQEKRVVALGSFDGVHYAHRGVLQMACTAAKLRSAVSTAFTFTTDPSALLGHPQPLLNTFAEREALLASCGLDETVYAAFDDTFRALSPEDFYRLLCEKLTPVCLVCGFNYTFGKNGEGNVALLRALCERDGIGLEVIDPVILGGITVSSTEIRACIERGEIAAANRMLGYSYTLRGTVSHGKKNGRSFGYPTANLPLAAERITPAFGVYLSLVEVDGVTYHAVTDVGTKPTVSEHADPCAESFLLDYTGDLYGKEITVRLLQFLRREQKFASRDELIARIAADVEAARRFFDE